MILGVGIDLCEVARIAEMMEKPQFLSRFFTAEEADYIVARGKAGAESAAGIFAAKEAALKALGTGLQGVALADVGVAHLESDAPYYALTGAARERMREMGGRTMHLSITHTGETAAAVAVLEG